jgi:hypothetical protein
MATVKFTRVGTIPPTGGAVDAFVRTANGTLHIVRPTSDSGTQGLSQDNISPSGAIQPAVSALSTDWGVSVPGLLRLPNGSLEALFGAAEPGTSDTSAWGITSSDGGGTWSAPVDIRSGPLEDLAYGAEFRAEMSGTTPVLILTVAGTMVVQQGLGQNTPSYQVTNASDGLASDADSTVDAASGQVVASWDSVQTNGGDFIQTVAPAAGTAIKVPGLSRDYIVLAGRDKGPGVFGAYTTDDEHVRLLRYNGGTVAVGSLAAVTPAALGVATGIDGRIWVMWGSDNGTIAVTRSNKAVTRFEPIQHLSAKTSTLFHLAGDGRLGPLDLLVDQVADTNPLLPAGLYHARVLPELSAAVKVQTITAIKNKKKVVTGHALTVTVTDAGDAVSGATVTVKGHVKKTSSKGVAKITLPGSDTGKVTVTVTAPAYQKLTMSVKPQWPPSAGRLGTWPATATRAPGSGASSSCSRCTASTTGCPSPASGRSSASRRLG